MNEINKALEALKDEDGENRAVRAFLMVYGTPGLTAAAMAAHMRRSGFDYVPAWVERSPEFLTKAGAQLWLRMLFALENPAAPATEDARPEREELYRAAINCPHEIDRDKIVLHFDPKQDGHNALNQLGRRLDAAAASPKASSPAPAAGQCGESCERAKLCGACARGLEEGQEPVALKDWEDPRVQKVYEILCDTETEPPEGHHWEGFQAQRIVAALAASQPAPSTTREFTNELGNAIKITIEGPTSTSENVLTPMEVKELLSSLVTHHSQSAPVEAQAVPEGFVLVPGEYGSTKLPYENHWATLEIGDRRLLRFIIKAFGNDHAAYDDLVALIKDARTGVPTLRAEIAHLTQRLTDEMRHSCNLRAKLKGIERQSRATAPTRPLQNGGE